MTSPPIVPVTGDGEGGEEGPFVDPTPFGTRTRLLTTYATEVQAIRNGADPFPVAIEVNVYNQCNQRCSWCISENVRDLGLALDVRNPNFRQFVADFRRLGGRALSWSGGGEPTLHPHFDEALDLVGAEGVAQGLMTHGAFPAHLVAPIARHCAWVRVSLDTTDPAAYRRNRGTDALDRVVENARSLVAHGASVGLNINIAEWNKDQIEPLYALARDLGVAYLQVRPTLPTPFRDGTPGVDGLRPESVDGVLADLDRLSEAIAGSGGGPKLLVSHDKFADMCKPDGGRADPDEGYPGCRSHRLFVVLNADGDLAVCMYHLFDDKFVFGNVLREPLEAIWASPRRKAVRQFCEGALDHEKAECQVCCKGHEINKVLIRGLKVPPGSGNGSPFI